MDYMTYKDFRKLFKLIPKDKRDTARIEIALQLGTFPSGEEGAEDWIMTATIEDATYHAETNTLWIEVDYS